MLSGTLGAVSLRRAIAMDPEEVATFLAERRNATLCTIHPDGSIHAVAMWFAVLDGKVVAHTKAKSQKARNLARDPRLTCLVESGQRYEELRGVEIVGRGELVRDPERLWEIGVAVFSRYVAPYGEGDRPALEQILRKRVGIVVRPERVVSWDHRKLARS